MKTITKMITREEEFYVAKDGREFSDENECLEYENELNIKSIEAYDENFNRTDFESAVYVVIHSDEEIKLIDEVCDYNGLFSEGLCEIGLFRYDVTYRSDKWKKVRIPNSLKNFIDFF